MYKKYFCNPFCSYVLPGHFAIECQFSIWIFRFVVGPVSHLVAHWWQATLLISLKVPELALYWPYVAPPLFSTALLSSVAFPQSSHGFMNEPLVLNLTGQLTFKTFALNFTMLTITFVNSTIHKSTLPAKLVLLDGDVIEIYRATAQTEVQRPYSKYGDALVSLENKVNNTLIKKISCFCYRQYSITVIHTTMSTAY